MRTKIAATVASASFVASCSAIAVRHSRATAASPSVQVQLVTDEADAALAILELRRRGAPIVEGAWIRLFASEGYRNLRMRELGMSRPFSDSAFRAFLLADSVVIRLPGLRQALSDYRRIDVAAAAARALRYLPDGAAIRSRLYLEIKPRINSFVYTVPEGRAIFLYLDPAKTRESVERDIVTHKLHHIGYAQSCVAETGTNAGPRAVARSYARGLGEGLAMLAAAGGVERSPHAESTLEVRQRWDRDFAHWPDDLQRIERFLTDIAEGRLTNSDSMTAIAAPFWGDAQGPWYTVGYALGATIERARGRDALRRVICDPSALLAAYNESVRDQVLPRWDARLIGLLSDR